MFDYRVENGFFFGIFFAHSFTKRPSIDYTRERKTKIHIALKQIEVILKLYLIGRFKFLFHVLVFCLTFFHFGVFFFHSLAHRFYCLLNFIAFKLWKFHGMQFTRYVRNETDFVILGTQFQQKHITYFRVALLRIASHSVSLCSNENRCEKLRIRTLSIKWNLLIHTQHKHCVFTVQFPTE